MNRKVVYSVGSRSEGIFLWAVLVCKSLVSGYDAGDDAGVGTISQVIKILVNQRLRHSINQTL